MEKELDAYDLLLEAKNIFLDQIQGIALPSFYRQDWIKKVDEFLVEKARELEYVHK